jgi:transposase
LGYLVCGRQQHPRREARSGGQKGGSETALGRSRGGWGSKIHLLTDGLGLPLAVVLSGGNRHESCYLEELVLAGYRGRWPIWLLGGRGYSAPRIRLWLEQHGIRPVIPYRKDELKQRPNLPELDRERYRMRNVIERTIGKLKQRRSITTRFEKLADSFLAIIRLAFIQIYLRTIDSSDTA